MAGIKPFSFSSPTFNDKTRYDIELSEKKKAANGSYATQEYDPYKHRDVEHPTS